MAEFPGPVRQPPHPEPIVVPETNVDLARKYYPPKPLPVWVRLDYPDGTAHDVEGFAEAWTRAHVLVQIPWHFEYYTSVKSVWVEAAAVRRRKIDQRWS